MKTDLTINTTLARTILTKFIGSELRRAGFERALIGLSGGLDSAVSCALAVEALGSQNVLALRLPYKTSSRRLARRRSAGCRAARCPHGHV